MNELSFDQSHEFVFSIFSTTMSRIITSISRD